MLEKPLLETTVADYDRVMGVNLRGVFLVGREGLRILREQGEGGRVINVASDLGHFGRENFSAYCASKAGVLTLTRSWAKEFGPDILINAIAPGPIDTDMLGPEAMSAEWREKEAQNPLQRVGSLPVLPKVMGYDPLMQFVHEDDCLYAFERATLAPHPGVFNIVGRGVLPLSTILRLAGKRAIPLPAPLLYRMAYYPSQGQTGDPPAGFYDYLRYLWVADGQRGWDAFGEPVYSTKEAWISFVSARRMRRYR